MRGRHLKYHFIPAQFRCPGYSVTPVVWLVSRLSVHSLQTNYHISTALKNLREFFHTAPPYSLEGVYVPLEVTTFDLLLIYISKPKQIVRD